MLNHYLKARVGVFSSYLAFTTAVSLTGSAVANDTVAIAAAVPHADHMIRDLGRRSGGDTVIASVTLKLNNEKELDRLIEDQQRPGSPAYHHWLTPAEFNARYAPTKAQEVYVAGALREAGLKIAETYPNHLMIKMSGPSALVENLFRTEIHLVDQGEKGIRYMNVKPALVPANIASLVVSANVSNVVTHHVHSHRVAPLLSNVAAAKSAKVAAGLAHSVGPDGYPLSPVVGIDYNFPTQHGVTGSGHTASIVIDSDVNESDLRAFYSYCGVTVTGTLSRKSIDGGVIGSESNGGDSTEAVLDAETITSLAPGANCILYVMGSLSDQDIYDAYNKTVTDNTAEVSNSSFGGSDVADHTIESISKQGIAQGITWSASSGDSGADSVGNPANEANFLAIGGTTFTVNSSTGAVTENIGWSGSTGGVSSAVPLPSYQQGVSGLAATNGRNVPDIAFPSSATDIYQDGSWLGVQGTSWSSPEYVACQTLINAKRGQRFGRTNTTIYGCAKRYYANDFVDVTSGNNRGYNCTAGYDNVTGWGELVGWNIGGHMH